MTNVTKYPLQDSFKTSLSQTWTGGTGTMYVASTPSFTFPSGITTYVVVNPGKSNMQIAQISAYDSSAKTLTVSNITLEKGASINSTAQTHNVGSEVIISDNYQFWKDIATAINSKLDDDGDWAWDSATDFGGAIMKSLTTAQRTALTATNGMIVYDTDLGELYQYIGGSWSAVSSGSTQPNASTAVAGKVELATDGEIAAGTDTGLTGASLVAVPSQINPNKFTDKTSATGADKLLIADSADSNNAKSCDLDDIREAIPASATLKGTVEMATDAEFKTGTDNSRYVNASQTSFSIVTGATLLKAMTDSDTTTETIYTKYKEIQLDYGGTYRVDFNLKTFGSGIAYGRIYVNGIATGTERTESASSYTTFTEDITVASGDLLQLYLKSSSGSYSINSGNMTVYYGILPKLLTYTVNDN